MNDTTTGGAPREMVGAVTASLIRSAMEKIYFKVATYVSRAATTPILNQSNERNAAILDATGRLAALSVIEIDDALHRGAPDDFAQPR
jgi:N-methylhydantoinase B/oxoprolinase/acetone carboxylase alpha subunit